MRNEYSVSELIKTAYALLITKLFYKGARLIRRPFFIRGKSSLASYYRLTTGYNCRMDLPGKNIKTLFLGDSCEMGDNVHLVAYEKVTLGNNVLIASKVFISDTNHGKYSGDHPSLPDTAPNERSLFTEPVSIGSNVWIGENVCVLPGTIIGNGCIIGANSVVKSRIPDNCIAAGIPAKVLKYYSEDESFWREID